MRAKGSRSAFLKNLSWIFFGNIAHAVLQFLLNIYVARELAMEDYGLINYAASLIAFFSAVGTLGFSGTITKKFAECKKNVGKYLGTTIISRGVYSICAILLLQIIVRLSSPSESILPWIVLAQSLSIFFSSGDLLIYWFRYEKKANVVAILRLCAFFVSAVWRLVAIAVFHSVVSYAVGVTLESSIYILMLFAAYQKSYSKMRLLYSRRVLKTMLKISYPFIFSAILTTIYGQTDKVMLKSMVDSTAVAVYSVALTLAGAVSIIPQALIEGFRPDIMQYKIHNEFMYRRRLRQLYAIVFWLCAAYGLVISLAAKPIILLLYGAKYVEAVPVLSLVVWYISFSYFGAINNMYMVAEDKTKWVQLLTLIGAVCNVGLNYLLIPHYGAVGAAFASLLTQVIANFVLLLIIPSLRDNFIVLLQGVALQDVFGRK